MQKVFSKCVNKICKIFKQYLIKIYLLFVKWCATANLELYLIIINNNNILDYNYENVNSFK